MSDLRANAIESALSQSQLTPLRVRRLKLGFGLWPEAAQTAHTLHLRTDSAGVVSKSHIDRPSGAMFPESTTLVPAGTALNWRVGMQFERLVFEIEPLALRRLATEFGVNLDQRALRETVPRFDPAVCFAKSMLETELANVSELSSMFIETLFRMLGLHIIRSYCVSQDKPTQLADQLRTICRQHLAESISVERMAGWVEMHAQQLQRWMKRELDTNPKRFLTELRLDAARTSLLDANTRLLDVALSTGFASHSHLTTVFKKEFGLTPSEFRATAIGANETSAEVIELERDTD
jgi:AraC family transcriptional regulator